MFNPTLVNDPFGDPGVYVELKYRREAFLFDLGEINLLPARKILRVRHIFVSHTHMDHFIGFDHLIRICLGRDQHISIFGPPGFLERVENKLQSYTWNLVENYTNDFELTVTEVRQTERLTRRYRCRNAFRAEGEERSDLSDDILTESDFFRVQGVLLDHSIPCLAFACVEKTRINIKKNVLQEMGLPTGPWLNSVKEFIIRGEPDERPVRIWWKNDRGGREETSRPLGLLREKIVKITPGQKICYITDVLWSDENIRQIVELARGAELMFIEASFLQEDADTAAVKYHLTARQAGLLAAMAGVKRFTLFHFSPKYLGRELDMEREARDAFLEKAQAIRS